MDRRVTGVAAIVLCLSALAGCASRPDPRAHPLFFDDFRQALSAGGWQVRERPGHPGLVGARWGGEGVSLHEEPGASAEHWLRLSAESDGTVAGTRHAQVCHHRKFLRGTYAARVRFSDLPALGEDGDVVVQTFYAVSPLRFDFDPDYSEIDWEYLPNGGWDDPATRLYAVTWQTARLEPWQAHNQPTQRPGSHAGWHVLVMQVTQTDVRWFLDGQPVAVHGGRAVPAVPMAIQFNLWFSPGGLLPAQAGRRVWQQDVDWVYHRKDVSVTPAQVEAEVAWMRAAQVLRVDEVPDLGLASICDF